MDGLHVKNGDQTPAKTNPISSTKQDTSTRTRNIDRSEKEYQSTTHNRPNSLMLVGEKKEDLNTFYIMYRNISLYLTECFTDAKNK